MPAKKNIFAIVGSASSRSANLQLVEYIAAQTSDDFHITIFNRLKVLPHFDPELSTDEPPAEIIEFREAINKADGVLICTPEYVYSIPAGLKNVFEWCVATTVFTGKHCGLITASAHGQKGHEELQLIVKTIMANFTPATTLLVQGVKGKINGEGTIIDEKTKAALLNFIEGFKALLRS